jgi:iron complex outermembrane receptor protein
MATAAAVSAQEQEPSTKTDAKSTQLEEVVVTGTSIRGVEPTGVQVIGITAEDVTISGATDSNALLATVPQVTNLFNDRTTVPPGVSNQIQIVRPNLRNLPGGTLATGAATLILLDGHRIPSVGVSQTAPDADMIPPGMIERVELATDGGSAIYGSDAIGGVINFITRRKVDGVELDVSYGGADNYDQYDMNLTAGKEWDTGSVYGSYSYADRGELLGKDRDWAQKLIWSDGTGSERRCTPANVSVGNVNYAMPNLQPNTVSSCDPSQEAALSPKQTRENFFAGVSQDVGDTLVFDLKGFYSQRDVSARGGPLPGLVNISSSNPYYMDVNGTNATQAVSFDFEPVTGDTSGDTETDFDAWNISPEVKFEFADDWVLRTLLNYGQGKTTFSLPQVNSTLLSGYASGTTLETAINPYNIADTVNTQLVNNILDWNQVGESKSELFNGRAIVDGPVYELPSGEVRIALGTEYLDEKFEQRQGFVVYGGEGDLEWADANRDVTSAFAELQIPIVGSGNNVPYVDSIDLSLAVRYDDYSDFGSTTNPKFGLDYSPVEWLTLSGNWGSSFNAPSLVDLVNSAQSTTSVFPFVPIVPPNVAIPPGSWAMALQGARPGLLPQEADTWAFGFDVSPPILPGLQVNANYYYIDFTDALGRPPVFDANLFFSNPGYAQFYVLNPTDEQISAAAATTSNPEDANVLLGPNAPHTFEIIDFRTTNLGNSKIRGLDAAVNYVRDMDFGTLNFGVAGNYRLQSRNQLGPGLSYESDLDYGQPLYFVKTTAGLTMGNFRAQTAWNYRDGYKVRPAANTNNQDHVDAFDVVDMFFGYDLAGLAGSSGWSENMTVTLNIQNVLDSHPPEYRLDNGDGFANGFTIGRMFQVGVSKTF